MKLTGWIIYNGHLPGNQFLDFAQWLRESAQKKEITTTIYKNNDLLVYLTSHSTELIQRDNYTLPDFVIFTDKDIYLAKQLELLGIRVFNRAHAIKVSDDKIATYQQLAKQKLPIPETIIAPKVFPSIREIDQQFLTKAVNTLGFPMVIKEAFGSFGEQVYLVNTFAELKKQLKEIQGNPFVFQEFIASSYGRDIRLHVVGDTVIASMLRKSTHDFRANISSGGRMEAYQPTKIEQELAIAATKAIGADFAGIDLLFGQNDTPLICEVNTNAHIRNMYHCTQINVADFIIDYIIKEFNDSNS